MKNIKEFFLTDIRLFNGYILIIAILLFLSVVGYTSYALFSSTVNGTHNIEIIVG